MLSTAPLHDPRSRLRRHRCRLHDLMMELKAAAGAARNRYDDEAATAYERTRERARCRLAEVDAQLDAHKRATNDALLAKEIKDRRPWTLGPRKWVPAATAGQGATIDKVSGYLVDED